MDLEYNDTDLYTQLCFYQHIFDAKKAMNQLSLNDKDQVQAVYSQTLVSAYKRLFQHVQQVLLHSAYSQVNLSSLFFMFFLNQTHSSSRVFYSLLRLDKC